ncbi:hypothetical protein BGX21_000676 [Mortierella sp. AD011]|nr:hypothetical protein BGX20_011504 [Mortierella sp. AD010]KAF9401772.1 hypothetical protein BGX21_000676 [Mortierella sp. AD011]
MSSEVTCLYVPEEGEIKIIPYKVGVTTREYLGPHSEGICFPRTDYRLAGFVRFFNGTDGVNKRCTAMYICEVKGPVIIVNEDENGKMSSLTQDDIEKIFN